MPGGFTKMKIKSKIKGQYCASGGSAVIKRYVVAVDRQEALDAFSRPEALRGVSGSKA
jgi:hypothetical protein